MTREGGPERAPGGARLPGLDVLRGLGALSVLAFHYTTRFGLIFEHPTAPFFDVPWGQRGVELFFVISGFSIERSVASAGSAREFLIARAVRLYPTFWAALAITFAVTSLFDLPERSVPLSAALVNLTMIPASLRSPLVDAAYWTLERELRFYLLPLALLWVGRQRFTLHVLLGAVAVQALSYSAQGVPRLLDDLLNVGWAHLFAGGALLARLRARPSAGVVAGLALCVGSSYLVGPTQCAWGAVALALVWLATGPLARVNVRALALLGELSFPLYLVHQYVGYVVMRGLYARGASTGAGILAATAVALGLGAALHFRVEKPCLAWLGRRRSQRGA